MNNILIIGAGSIGALIGSALIEAGVKVTFACKPNSNYTEMLQTRGLQLHYPNGKRLWISALHPQVRFIDTASYLQQKFDIIIVALKSNHLIDVISYIQAHSTPDTILIHAQNGIPYWWFNCDRYLAAINQKTINKLNQHYLTSVDPDGILSQELNQFTSVGCVIKAPCQRNALGHIQIKKTPQLILGFTKQAYTPEQKATIEHLCNLFTQYGIPAELTQHIRTAICHKLAINLTTNVLSALMGKVIAELTAHPSIDSLIKTIIAEINYVFSCYGIPVKDLPTEEKIYSYIKTPGSQSHLPSLAQDLSQHKLGEISLITAPVEMAEIARLKIPTLESLSKLLQLAQTYSLNSRGRAPILTMDSHSGYCLFTKDICESSIINRYQISHLINHLIQVNVSALSHSKIEG